MLLECKFALFVIATLALSCGARSTADRASSDASAASQNANSSPHQPSPSPIQITPPSAIRNVDFKNFIYPWYPSYLESRQSSREVTLRDGMLETKRDSQFGVINISLNLNDVSYVDLLGDNNEEAIVTVDGVTGVNRFVGSIFIFGIEKGKPRLLWQHETGDRAEGGLRRIAAERGTLILEEYARSYRDGGLCCPTKFIRSHFRWNGTDFKKLRSEMLPNEYQTAEFLGFANDKSAANSSK